MSDERKKAGAGFWIAVALVVVLLGYPLSFGPACWITSRIGDGERQISVIYRLITCGLSHDHSGKLDGVIRWYAKLGAANASWGWWDIPNGDPELQWVWGVVPTY